MTAPTPHPETTHGAAVALADDGYSVFPLHRPEGSGCSCQDTECENIGKHPRTRKGLHDASRDFELIDEWFARWPHANLAIRTGAVSGVFVVDVDGAEGAETMAELPGLPPSVEVRTGAGAHIWSRWPDQDVRNSAGRIGPGVDIRGTGGYVIAPPSLHESGRRYEWVRDPWNHDLLDAPAWLLDLVVPKVPDTYPAPKDLPDVYGSRYVIAAIEDECATMASTPEGQRNDQLNRSAFALARFVTDGKIDAATIVRHLAHAAARAGLGEREITLTLKSAFRARGAA